MGLVRAPSRPVGIDDVRAVGNAPAGAGGRLGSCPATPLLPRSTFHVAGNVDLSWETAAFRRVISFELVFAVIAKIDQYS